MDNFFLDKARIEFRSDYAQKIEDVGYTLSSDKGYVLPSDGLSEELEGLICIVAYIQSNKEVPENEMEKIRTEILPAIYKYEPKAYNHDAVELPVVVRPEYTR